MGSLFFPKSPKLVVVKLSMAIPYWVIRFFLYKDTLRLV